MDRDRLLGYAVAATSASGFGIMPALAVLAYRRGMMVDTVLAFRFAVAAACFAPVAWWRARRRGERPPLRGVLLGLLMGSVLYAGQATCYFTSVHRSSPALGALLLYLYPGFVAVGAAIVARRRPPAALVGALVLAFAGIALSLGPVGAVDAGAVAAGVGAACFYTAYILVGNHAGGSLTSSTMSALVFCSATVTYAVLGTAAATLRMPRDATTWGLLLAIGTVSTALAIWFFFLAMERIGPTMASLASTLEPIGAVVGGAVVIGTPMTGLQVLGAVLVIAGAVAGMLLTPAGADAGTSRRACGRHVSGGHVPGPTCRAGRSTPTPTCSRGRRYARPVVARPSVRGARRPWSPPCPTPRPCPGSPQPSVPRWPPRATPCAPPASSAT